MTLEQRETGNQNGMEGVSAQDGAESLRVFETFLPELFSFVGIGPELHDLIRELDKAIIEAENDKKTALLEKRNSILKDIFQDGLRELFGIEVGQDLAEAIIARLEAVPLKERVPTSNRHRDNCFIVYPDTFGGFRELAVLLPILRSLGVTKLHILPFFDNSGDGGYAVRYHSIDKPLQVDSQFSSEEFAYLVSQAQQFGISLVVDVILNHMAVDSPLLESEGVAEKLLLSWPSGEKPVNLVRTEEDLEAGGTYAVYKLGSGVEVRVLVMFPEQAGEDPLFVVHQDRDVYHTFYPFQVDLDFDNPQAFLLVSNIVLQAVEMIGRQGQIRLDAIPFIGKKIDHEIFQNMDSESGYKIITLLRILVALAAPDVGLVAEASRPISEIEKYLNRVGSAYDFISLPYFLQAVATDDPRIFLEKVSQMVGQIGLDNLSKLVFALQTHDDYPLAELNDPIANHVWQSLQGKGAEPFGRADGKESTPKGAAIRLSEVCDSSPEKLAATVALASFTPHGDLFFLYGTEIGLENDQANLAREVTLAETEQRKVDRRAVIRPHLELASYLERVGQSESFGRISKLLQSRRDYLPERIIEWDYTVTDSGITQITMSGEKDGLLIRLLFVVNFSGEEQPNLAYEGELLVSSTVKDSLGPWDFCLYKVV